MTFFHTWYCTSAAAAAAATVSELPLARSLLYRPAAVCRVNGEVCAGPSTQLDVAVCPTRWSLVPTWCERNAVRLHIIDNDVPHTTINHLTDQQAIYVHSLQMHSATPLMFSCKDIFINIQMPTVNNFNVITTVSFLLSGNNN